MDSNQISFQVIKVSQPMGDFFIGNLGARELVGISFSDVRRIEGEQRDVEKYLGVQRELDKTRVKKIKQYLNAPDASFPTGVILAVDQNCAEFDPVNSVLILKSYDSEFIGDSIPYNKIAKVLDGQHRIAAFTDEEGYFDSFLNENIVNFQFNVVLFVGLDIDEQANIFATVNLAQTKVNKSLVYDLEGLSKTRSPFRTCHQIAVALDSADERSPLYHRIKRLGVKTKGREGSEPLTQAGFVESLIKLISNDPFNDRSLLMRGKKLKKENLETLQKLPFRNLFIEERDNDIALIVYNYFKSIEKTWPKSWNDLTSVGNILPKSNAFKAFMRFLKPLYLQIVGNDIGRIVSIDEFYKYFSDYNIKDYDFTSENFAPGSGGESSFYKILIKQIDISELKR